jgi:hypothetical protein
MKHPSSYRLYEYWNAQRGLRVAPSRADIDPGAIRHVLADTFMLGIAPQEGHPFRIAGTRVCAAFGRELKGQAFVDLWRREHRGLLADLLASVIQEPVGVVASVNTRTSEGAALEFELLLLPLRHQGRMDRRILGALAPTAIPHWFGAHAVGPLTLGPHRFLGPATATTALPRLATPMPSGRMTRGFVVYEGGRA